jgi:hypothetical protein
MNLAIKKFIPLFSLMASLLLYGCNGGVSANAVNGNNTIDHSPVAADLVFDQFGQIPKAGANKKILIGLHNTTSKKLALNSIRVINPLTGRLDNTLATIDSSECIMLTKMAGCNLGVTSHLSHSGSFLLEAEFNDVNGMSHAASQLIRYNERIEATNGLAFENDFHELTTADGNYRLALPVVITEAFDNLTVTNGNLACDNGYQAGSSCTYFANGKINGANELIGLKLAAFRGGQEIASKTSSIYTTITNAGNLLITQPADLHIAKDTLESSTSVTLYNSGNAPVSNMTILAEGKLSYQAGDCGATLESHTSCTLNVKANSEFNGSDILTIDYQRTADGSKNAHLAVNVYYLKEDSRVGLLMRVYQGELFNVGVLDTATQDIEVTNSGITTLDGLVYQLNPQHKSFSLTPFELAPTIPACGAGLTGGKKCGLRISYAPEEATVANPRYRLDISGSYRTAGGNKLTVVASYEEAYTARFYNVTLSSSFAMMGNANPVYLQALLDNGQTSLELALGEGSLSQQSCNLDAATELTASCRLQITTYNSSSDFTRWDPANVENSTDPNQPAPAYTLPLTLTATTTNNVRVNGNKSPATIHSSVQISAPYVYLLAATNNTPPPGEYNVGISWDNNTRFSDDDDCTLHDKLTGLVWVKDLATINNNKAVNWSDALDLADTGNWCGYNDWRIPNINELSSLIDNETVLHSNMRIIGFKNFGTNNDYWSSTTLARNPSLALGGDSDNNSIPLKTLDKSDSYFMLVVRGGY